MSPERIARLVARWVRAYTRDLPTPIARRRIEEIDADLHDHIAHERSRGTSERRIALGIASRMVRGIAADATWRRRLQPLRRDPMKAVLAVLAAAIGVAAVVLGEGDDSPGLQLLGVLFVVGAVTLGMRAARRRGRPPA
jgi:hypothetical protein